MHVSRVGSMVISLITTYTARFNPPPKLKNTTTYSFVLLIALVDNIINSFSLIQWTYIRMFGNK